MKALSLNTILTLHCNDAHMTTSLTFLKMYLIVKGPCPLLSTNTSTINIFRSRVAINTYFSLLWPLIDTLTRLKPPIYSHSQHHFSIKPFSLSDVRYLNFLPTISMSPRLCLLVTGDKLGPSRSPRNCLVPLLV